MNTLGRIITNAVKLFGLLIGLLAPHGAFSHQPEAAVLAFAGFLIAGAQLSEQTIIGLMDRYFGGFTKSPPPRKRSTTPRDRNSKSRTTRSSAGKSRKK